MPEYQAHLVRHRLGHHVAQGPMPPTFSMA